MKDRLNKTENIEHKTLIPNKGNGAQPWQMHQKRIMPTKQSTKDTAPPLRRENVHLS